MTNPKSADLNEKSRLSLDVPKAVKDRLEALKVRSEASTITDVFKRSLACYNLLLDHLDRNGKIILENADGTREVLRIL